MVLNRTNNFLRKHRKSPFSPFKTKWHLTFSQDQAFRILKQSSNSPNSDQTHLLQSLITSSKSHSCHPTPKAYNFILKTLSLSSQFHLIPPVLHRLESVEKFQTPEFIFADLIKVFGKFNRIHDAVSLFRRIPMFRCVPTSFSLNSLLFVLCNNSGGLKMVPEILLNALKMGIRVDESTFRILVTALYRIGKVGYAIEILNFMINDGYGVSPRICSLVLSAMCESRESTGDEVLSFMEGMRRKGFCPVVKDYCNVIKFFVRSGRDSDAVDFFNVMKADGFKPDIVCYTMVLSGVIADGDFKMAEELFDELLIFGLIPDIYTFNVYIHGLCKQGNPEAGIQMISRMEELGCKPDVITYNTLFDTLCKSGEFDKARKLRCDMQRTGLAANLRTFRIMIDGLFNNGEVIEACDILEEMLESRFPPQISTFCEILCWLCERDMVTKALELLKLVVGKNFSPGAKAWEIMLISSGHEFTYVNSFETKFRDLVED